MNVVTLSLGYTEKHEGVLEINAVQGEHEKKQVEIAQKVIERCHRHMMTYA